VIQAAAVISLCIQNNKLLTTVLLMIYSAFKKVPQKAALNTGYDDSPASTLPLPHAKKKFLTIPEPYTAPSAMCLSASH
jgi:hypothetical protein